MKIKLILSVFVFLIFHSFGFSQNNEIDSLLTVLKTAKEDTSKVNILNNLFTQYEFLDSEKAKTSLDEAFALAKKIDYKKGLAVTYGNLGDFAENHADYTEALKHYLTSFDLFKKIEDKRALARAFNRIGVVYYYQGDYPKTLENYFSSLKMNKEINNKKGEANTYNNIGAVYYIQGIYPEALKNYFEALKIKEAIGDKNSAADTYNNIGIIYKNQGNYKEALKHFVLYLTVKKECGDKRGQANAHINVGNVYKEQGDFEEALKNDFEALKLFIAIGDNAGIASAYNNIGIIYKYTKNFTQALKNNFEALHYYEKIGDKKGIGGVYNNIGNVFFKQKNYSQAEIYLNKAKLVLSEIGYKENLKSTYKALADLDSAKGNYKEAYVNYKKYILYRDSLDNEIVRKKVIQNQMNFDFEKKELATKLEEEKKLNDFKILAQQKSTRQNIVLIILLAILLIISIGAYFVYRNYKQKQTIRDYEKNSLKQKLLLSQMNPHFIFNSIDNIQGLIHNNQNQDAIDYLTGFSKLTRQILENSSQTYISFAEEMNMIENYLKIQQLLHNNSFSYSIVVSDAIEQETIFIPPMLTQPFIENSIKHGVNTKTKKGEIKIDFLLENEKLIVKITDTGKGFVDKEKESNHKSMAIKITKERLNNYTLKQDSLIQLNNLLDSNSQIIGAQVVVEIPYIYET